LIASLTLHITTGGRFFISNNEKLPGCFVTVAVQGGSIDFQDCDADSGGPSPVFSYSEKGMKCSRVGKVAWSDLPGLFQELQTGALYPQYQTPDPGPMWLKSASFKPFMKCPAIDTPGGVATYEFAEVTLEFDSENEASDKKDESPNTEPIISRRFSASGEFVTIPARKLKWESDGVNASDDVEAGLNIVTVEHHISVLKATSIPWDAIKKNAGRVNANDIPAGGFWGGTVPAECLLFLGGEISYSLNLDRSASHTLEYKFSERCSKTTFGAQEIPITWNHTLRPSHIDADLRWDRLLTRDSGEPVYLSSSDDFRSLFSFPI